MKCAIVSATAFAVGLLALSGAGQLLDIPSVLGTAQAGIGQCLRNDSYQEETCLGAKCTGSWTPGANKCNGVSIQE